MLDGLRVLDLADGSGALCGRILGDLGADVVKIEPPGGEAARREPPFAGDIPDNDRSLTWFAANLNKRAITLDITCETGWALFMRLVETADVVVSTPTGGRRIAGARAAERSLRGSKGAGAPFEIPARRGGDADVHQQPTAAAAPLEIPPRGWQRLDYEELAAINPRVIVVSMTPYGIDADFQAASDLEVTASSGSLWLAGEAGRTPVRTSVPQSPAWTGMYAAAGVLTAVLARDVTGRGQQVDVSAQAGMLTATSQAPIFWDLLREEQYRSGPFLVGRSVTGAQFRNIWPCRDGYVTFALYGGQAGRDSGRALVAWMNEVMPIGAPPVLQQLDWDQLDIATAPQSVVDDIEAAIAPFFAALSKAEFSTSVTSRNILGYPCSTVDDMAADPQLVSRGFWQPVDTAWNGQVCVPGSFALFDGVRPPVRGPAPRIGQHNVDILCDELGLARDELAALRSAGVI